MVIGLCSSLLTLFSLFHMILDGIAIVLVLFCFLMNVYMHFCLFIFCAYNGLLYFTPHVIMKL